MCFLNALHFIVWSQTGSSIGLWQYGHLLKHFLLIALPAGPNLFLAVRLPAPAVGIDALHLLAFLLADVPAAAPALVAHRLDRYHSARSRHSSQRFVRRRLSINFKTRFSENAKHLLHLLNPEKYMNLQLPHRVLVAPSSVTRICCFCMLSPEFNHAAFIKIF